MPTRPLSDPLQAHSVPHYIKIDIAGYNDIALEDLRTAEIRPPFISAVAHDRVVLDVLFRFGYAAYQIVNVGEAASRASNWPIRLADGSRALHAFCGRCSGARGEDLPDQWLTAGQAADVIRHRRRLLAPGWCDIHARQ